MRKCANLLVVGALLVVCSLLPWRAPLAGSAPARAGRVPRGSEMVFVSKGPFTARQSSSLETASLLEQCRWFADLDFGDDEFTKSLAPSRFCVLAAPKHSSVPEGCRLVLLAPHNQATRDYISRHCTAEPGYRVPVWKYQVTCRFGKSVTREFTYFFSFPLPDVFLQAYDEKSLREVLERVESEAPGRLPPALDKYAAAIDGDAQFWAIRTDKGLINPWWSEREISQPSALCMDWVKQAVRIRVFGLDHGPKGLANALGVEFAAQGEFHEAELRARDSQKDVTAALSLADCCSGCPSSLE